MTKTHENGKVVALRPHPDSLAALRNEVEQLRHALQSRIVIEQAKGAVSVRLDTTPDVAFEMMRELARRQRRSLHEFAAAVVANRGSLDV